MATRMEQCTCTFNHIHPKYTSFILYPEQFDIIIPRSAVFSRFDIYHKVMVKIPKQTKLKGTFTLYCVAPQQLGNIFLFTAQALGGKKVQFGGHVKQSCSHITRVSINSQSSETKTKQTSRKTGYKGLTAKTIKTFPRKQNIIPYDILAHFMGTVPTTCNTA